MSHKRHGTFNHYESNRYKQQKTYSSQHPDGHNLPQPAHRSHNIQHPDTVPNRVKPKDNPVLQHIERLPDPAKCEPCILAAAECNTGLVALLSKLEAEHMTFKGDRDILHHARELRKLLSARDQNQNHASGLKMTALDQKWPAKDGQVYVPTYILQQLEKAKSLPPLPPIVEPHLQEAVFTHVSIHTRTLVKGSDNSNDITYERLEFLGDAYIELMASRLLYSRLPHLDVPQQATLREQLVKNETLGQFSIAYGLPDRLKHGAHVKESKAWKKVVADVFEAYVAGVVLSDPKNGFETAENWLTKLWSPQMLDFQPKIIENPQAKDDLARLIQGKDVSLEYREERSMVHENGIQKYFVGVYMTGWGYQNEWLGSGEGRNKAQAAVAAATNALNGDNVVVKTAAMKKQEIVDQKQAAKRAMTQEIQNATARASEEVKDSKTTGKEHIPASNAEVQQGQKPDRNELSIKDPTQWLQEELDKKNKGEPPAGQSSWLEKEMKKKEKKERREKKRQEAPSNNS
ncbi:unnamed protein product [Periconia digitata]|uniref:Uncharacterized protein n=1 Tax=Periconia digitata TaxID=1303443 RepID=A0A9W4XJ52_9PLEO|nr:unnamed protein product [Periconia digitata]